MPVRNFFAFLRNIPLSLAGAAKSVYWQIFSGRMPPDRIVLQIRTKALKARMCRGGIDRLEARYKAADFMLSRILRVKAPSMARSFTIYEYALRMGLYARLCIGAKARDGDGRQVWVEIGGVPFPETDMKYSASDILFEG